MSERPVLFIQCDWDDAVRKSRGTAWVSLRKRGDSNQVHGKIENSGFDSCDKPRFIATNGFSAELLANDIVKVEHKQSSSSSMFLAPTKIYTEIHKKSIPCIDVTTTGLCVSYCFENNLIVWDFNRGEQKLKFEGHVGDVYRSKFFPSEKVVMSCGADMQLKIWCAETGRCPVSLKGHKRAVTDFAIVDVGRNVISVSKDGSIKLWDCGESTCLDTLLCVSSDINCCAITNVPESFPIGAPDNSHSEREVGTKNKILIAGCEDGTVHCVAVYSRKKLFTNVLNSPVNSVEFISALNETASDIKYIVGCQNGSVSIYDVINPKEPIKILWDLNSPVLNVLPYKDLGFFVSHAEGSVYFIKDVNFDKMFSLTGPDCDPIYGMSTDGRFLYTACRDGVIRRYAVERALNRLLET